MATISRLQSEAASLPDTHYSVLLRLAALSYVTEGPLKDGASGGRLHVAQDLLEAIGRRIAEVKADDLHIIDVITLLSLWPHITNIQDKHMWLTEIGRFGHSQKLLILDSLQV